MPAEVLPRLRDQRGPRALLTDPHGGRLNVLTHAGNVAAIGSDDLADYYGFYVLNAAANSAVRSCPPRCYRDFGINEPGFTLIG